MRKDIIELFKSNGFHIEVITGLISVDFLDINLNLRNNTYLPYKKPNDSMLYPPQIIKQLPVAIAARLSKNSSNQTIVESANEVFKTKKPPR